MTSITIFSGAQQETPTAGPVRSAFGLVSTCRNSVALAMMSARDLDDLGLLPWEVRSETWRKAPDDFAP